MRINRLNRLYKYGWAFGLSQACVLLSFRFGFMRLYNKALGWKKTAVVNYVKQHYAHIINRYGALDSKPAAVGDDFVVWFFWDNEVMPPIVRKCYEALLVNSNGHEVRLLSEKNIGEFLAIPDVIKDKRAAGLMSIQHYSDYLRFALLYKYGGLWVDATVLLTSPLAVKLDDLFVSVRNHELRHVPNNGFWQIYFIGGGRGNILFGFLRDLLVAYWEHEDDIIDYFFTDYSINVAYGEFPSVRRMIDALPSLDSVPDVHSLLFNLNKKFDKSLFDDILSCVHIHKLTYRGELKETVDGNVTFYGWLLNSYKI